MPSFFSRWWVTAATTFADRLMAFAVPLFVLKGLHDEVAYTAVEYIISMSVMVATFGDLGIRNYILYQYRQSGDKAETTRLTLAGYFCVLVLQGVMVGMSVLVVAFVDGEASLTNTGPLIVAAVLRAAALGTTMMAYQLAVLHDRPALASLPSLCQWIAVLGAVLAWPKDASDTLGLAIAVPSLPIMLLGLALTAKALRKVGLRPAIKQVIAAARWAWPLLASAALSIGIANVSRIYGFSHLAQSDLVALNFWLRVLSLVQLMHVATMATLALEIYDHREPGILRGNLQKYLKTLGVASALVCSMFFFTHGWFKVAPAISIGAFCAIGLYTLAWCMAAYFECYVTRDGQLKVVLKMAALATGVYAVILFIARPATIASLALVMAVAALMNLILLARAARGVRVVGPAMP